MEAGRWRAEWPLAEAARGKGVPGRLAGGVGGRYRGNPLFFWKYMIRWDFKSIQNGIISNERSCGRILRNNIKAKELGAEE